MKLTVTQMQAVVVVGSLAVLLMEEVVDMAAIVEEMAVVEAVVVVERI
jgi:hypothetical protein